MPFEQRWKYPNAQDYSLKNPISLLYEGLQTLSPMKSFFAHAAVILHADARQSDLLNKACFGRPMLSIPKDSLSSGNGTNGSFVQQEEMPNDESKEALVFELGLEEAFFLCHELKCLQVYGNAQQGQVVLKDEDLWQLMLQRKPDFLCYYKAYSHLRMKNWVVRTGLQYGAHFIVYRHHPAQVHAEYAAIVVSEWEKQIQLGSWSHMQGIIRLCGSVAKTLLLLHVIPKKAGDSNPSCLDLYSLQEVEVKRWNPKKHRQDRGMPIPS